jgi:hypothetical protein
MAFPYEKKMDESIDKHSKADKGKGKFPPKKSEEHAGVTLDEVYEAATPEEREMLASICERIDAKESGGGAPPFPPEPSLPGVAPKI